MYQAGQATNRQIVQLSSSKVNEARATSVTKSKHNCTLWLTDSNDSKTLQILLVTHSNLKLVKKENHIPKIRIERLFKYYIVL